MFTTQDTEKISDFIVDLKNEIREDVKRLISLSENVPNLMVMFLKRIEDNKSVYGFGAGEIELDVDIKNQEINRVFELIEKNEDTVLCSVETIYNKGIVRLNIFNYVSGEKYSEEIIVNSKCDFLEMCLN